MDGILTDGRTGKLWMCKKTDGHALGIVMRVKIGERFAHQLFLFRGAIRVGETINMKTVEIPPVSILGAAEGTIRDIECDCCHSKRTWWMGEAALERFFESRNKRTLSRIHGQETEKERV